MNASQGPGRRKAGGEEDGKIRWKRARADTHKMAIIRCVPPMEQANAQRTWTTSTVPAADQKIVWKRASIISPGPHTGQAGRVGRAVAIG